MKKTWLLIVIRTLLCVLIANAVMAMNTKVVVYAEDIVSLTEQAKNDAEKAQALVKEYAGKMVPFDIEEDIHEYYKSAIAARVELIKIDKGNLKDHQEGLRETRSSYFWFKKMAQFESIAVDRQDATPRKQDPDRLKRREERAAEKYEEAKAFENEHPNDLWGIKATYQDVLDYYGTSVVEPAKEKVDEYDLRIAEWKSEDQLQDDLMNARSTMERLQLKYKIAAGSDTLQELRRSIKEMINDRDLDIAQEYIDQQFHDSGSTFALRAEVSRVKDYVQDVVDLFVYAQQGAKEMLDNKLYDFEYNDGAPFRARVLSVETGALVVSIPNSGVVSMRVGLFLLSDSTIRRLAKLTKLPVVQRMILGSYILTDEVKYATKLLEEVDASQSWRRIYSKDIDSRARIALIEKEIQSEEKRIKKLDRLFKPLFKKVKSAKYDQSINGPLAKFMKKLDDVRDEDIVRLDIFCSQEAAMNLNEVFWKAHKECKHCRKSRRLICPKCKGKGKVRRIGPGASNAPKYIKCPTCNAKKDHSGKNGDSTVVDCVFCYNKHKSENEFGKLVGFIQRINDVLEDDE